MNRRQPARAATGIAAFAIALGVGFSAAVARAEDRPESTASQAAASDKASAVDVGSRRELFVDRHAVDRLDGAELQLHHPTPAGVAIEFNEPWEGAFVGYVTVLEDGDKRRMYYRGIPVSGGDATTKEVTCYAESPDGVHWTKPKLGLFEVDGSRDNNVVLANAAPATHNLSPFLDKNPAAPADQRFKALGGTGQPGLFAFASADGIHWRKLADEPVLTVKEFAFDSQNVSFWSEAENCYVCYFRTWDKFRTVSRATSDDFVHWGQPTAMTYGDTPREHLYTNQTQPYYRAPHIAIGVAARFMPGRKVISDEDAQRIGVDPKYYNDCSDAVLLTTRGGSEYSRTFMDAFVRPGLGVENWVSRTNYPALGIVPTGENEMSLYIQRNYGQPTAHLDRLVMRPDGFASLHGSYAGGEGVTKPLVFAASANGPTELHLNVSTGAAGGVRVELQDADGQPLPGYSLADCDEVIGDALDRVVRWRGQGDLAELAGTPVRLRLSLRDADVYAFQFD